MKFIGKTENCINAKGEYQKKRRDEKEKYDDDMKKSHKGGKT